jgi:hypothetical protein
MEMLLAAGSTSIVLAAFCWMMRLPDYHQHNHIYRDEDGEALPAKHDEERDRTVRILVVLFALATLLLSIWTWIEQGHDTNLAIIAVAWVLYQSGSCLIFLTECADNHHRKVLPACPTAITEAATLRYCLANSSLLTHVDARVSSHYIQGISRSIHVMVSSRLRSRSCFHMLFSAETSYCILQRLRRGWTVHLFCDCEVGPYTQLSTHGSLALTAAGTPLRGYVRSWTRHANLAVWSTMTYRHSGMRQGRKT